MRHEVIDILFSRFQILVTKRLGEVKLNRPLIDYIRPV
jgi:hypothetical protein